MERRRSTKISSVSATSYARSKCLNLYIVVLLSLNGIYVVPLAPVAQAFSNNHRLITRTRFSSYHATPPQTPTSRTMTSDPTNEFEPTRQQKQHHRRVFLQSLTISSAMATANLLVAPKPALAADETATAAVEMKTFVDPKGLFVLNVPKRFFAIRRTIKGDLPNEETGEGRRGSSIFTAGDMSKAEVVAVERYVFFNALSMSQYIRLLLRQYQVMKSLSIFSRTFLIL